MKGIKHQNNAPNLILYNMFKTPKIWTERHKYFMDLYGFIYIKFELLFARQSLINISKSIPFRGILEQFW